MMPPAPERTPSFTASHLSPMLFSRLPLLLLVIAVLSGCTASRRILLNAPGYSDQFRFDAITVPPAAEPFAFHMPQSDPQLGDRVKVLNAVLGFEPASLTERLVHSNTQAFLVIRNDSLLYEFYGQGLTAEDPMTSFSVAKTFVGYLVGVGLQEGFIGSLSDPVQRYLPAFPLSDVTLDHLLNHTSGIDFPADGWQYYTKNLARLPEKVQGYRRPPGTGWRYENGNSQLLAMVLETASGESMSELLASRIWQRIGTEDAARWSEDGHGMVKAFCCLNARAIDFARFGRLMLRLGDWDGEQLVPRDYLVEAAKGDTKEGRYVRYKRQQWLENEAAGIYLANGLYGQYIYIYPAKNLMIVRFAKEGAHVHAIWSELLQTVIEQL